MATDTKITLTRYTPSLTTLYLVVRNKTAGTAWNPTAAAWQAYTAAGYASFKISAGLEVPAASGDYEFDFSTTNSAAGTIEWTWNLQAGGSPSLSNDTVAAEGGEEWDGTTFGPVSAFTKYQITGKVSDAAPQAGSFIISLTNGFALPTGNDYVGLWLCWATGTNQPSKQAITGYTYINSTTARVTFANGFVSVPSNGDQFNIL